MFALAAIPTMLSVAGLLPNGGLTTGIATVIGIAGATILGLAELGSTRHLIDFRRIAPVVTIALIGMPLWIGMISALIVAQGGGWPARLDRAGIVSIVLGIAMIVWIVGTAGVLDGPEEPGRSQMIALAVPMAGIVGWPVWLGIDSLTVRAPHERDRETRGAPWQRADALGITKSSLLRR